MDVGVDGWWPDQGDGFDGPSRLNRHRMYWEGTQLYPAERAAVRAASQRVGRHPALRRLHLVGRRADALGDAEDARPRRASTRDCPACRYWGTDIGGFNPTAGIHRRAARALVPVRRVQSARSARTGATGICKLPWGWDGGDGGPFEAGTVARRSGGAEEPEVETICRQVSRAALAADAVSLHGRARDARDRPADHARAVAAPSGRCGGGRARRRVPVGPRHARRARRREGRDHARVYLPRGRWFDFWTNERVEGGREIDRPVDLATMPLYVRAGAVIPMGPVRQYTDEPSTNRLRSSSTRAPTARAERASYLYEDDGKTFAYRKGAWMRIAMDWRGPAPAAAGARAGLAHAATVAAAVRRPHRRRIDDTARCRSRANRSR